MCARTGRASVDGKHIRKHSVDVIADADTIFDALQMRTLPDKTNFFTETFLLSSNNNITNLRLHCSFYTCHTG